MKEGKYEEPGYPFLRVCGGRCCNTPLVEWGPRFMNSAIFGTRITGIDGHIPEAKFEENVPFILCDLLNWVRHKYLGNLFSVASENSLAVGILIVS